jgi:stearoyl-CoA desaturase (delta-9 desaturase)
MSTSVPAAAQAKAFPDGTTDYKPLRGSSAKADINKVHISDQPMTWSNWHQHVNWLNTTFIVFIPILGLISCFWVPLKLNTAIFSIVYYFNTGLGITGGKYLILS